MTKQDRNYWYWMTLRNYGFDVSKDFFSLEPKAVSTLFSLAKALRCKGENGKSPARTLWTRAQEGLPF